MENQHEPLIDRKSFDTLGRKLKSRQRPRQTGECSLFAGLLKCGECGKSLTIRYTNDKHPKQIYSCKTYNAYGKNHCTQHRIEYETLYRFVLNKIRECARAALMMEKTQKEQAELKAKVEESRKELDAATLNRLIKEIVVHETIDSDKTRQISIEIHFNLKPIPEVEQVTG